MDIIITQWALNSYLDLLHQSVFTPAEYRSKIRGDVLLLKNYPLDPKFTQSKFWSKAQDSAGNIIANGYKMKWHQVGNGLVQLRLPVGIFKEAFLCSAYVKQNTKQEKRELAKFKTYLQLIRQQKFTVCGRLI